jgi:hypothetical protein
MDAPYDKREGTPEALLSSSGTFLSGAERKSLFR